MRKLFSLMKELLLWFIHCAEILRSERELYAFMIGIPTPALMLNSLGPLMLLIFRYELAREAPNL